MAPEGYLLLLPKLADKLEFPEPVTIIGYFPNMEAKGVVFVFLTYSELLAEEGLSAAPNLVSYFFLVPLLAVPALPINFCSYALLIPPLKV